MSFYQPIYIRYNLIEEENFLYENLERKQINPYYMSETTGFINKFIDNYSDVITDSIRPDDKAQPHQKYILNFLNENTPYRGLLVYHGLGSGKTAASIFTSQGYNKEIVVMTPVSLKNNYEDEIKTFGEKLYTTNNNWVWVPLIEFNENYNIFLERLHKLDFNELVKRYKLLNRIEEDDRFIESIGKNKKILLTYLLLNNYIPFLFKSRLDETIDILDKLIEFYNSLKVKKTQNILKKTKGLKDYAPITFKEFKLGTFIKKILQSKAIPQSFTFEELEAITVELKQLSSNPETNKLLQINTEEIDKLLADKKLVSLEYLMSNGLLTTINKSDNIQLGLFMIQNGESNYEGHQYKEEIDSQIEKFYNMKYKFIGYTSGTALFLSKKGQGIFDQLIPKYQLDLIKDEVNAGDKDEELYQFNIDKFIKFMEVLYKKYQNPFDNKVVVIDEIHNLTGMMLGSGYRMNYLYELLMRATNCNLIFLSGTPVINVPYQLAITFNLLRGLLKMYHIKIISTDKELTEYGDLLYRNPYIDRFNINFNEKTLDFSLLPIGFINNFITKSGENFREGVIKNIVDLKTEDEILDEILKIFIADHTKIFFEKNDYSISSIFPDFLNKNVGKKSFIDIKNSQFKKQNQDKFNEMYINSIDMTINERSIVDMQKRIIGLVSHFNEVSDPDSKIFPSVFFNNELLTDETDLKLSCENRGLDISGNNDELNERLENFGMKKEGDKSADEVYLSDLQLMDYLEKRYVEYEKEEKERKKQMMQNIINGNSETFSFFKVLTRQCGNFTFPTVDKQKKAIKRILRSEFRKDNKLKKELLFLMNKICDDDEGKKQELLSQLCEKITNSKDSVVLKDFYQEIINTINESEDIDFEKRFQCKDNMEILEQDIDEFCTATSDFNDIEEYFDKESKKYDESISKLIETLDIDHLNFNINTDFQFNLMELSPKFYKILNNIYETKGLVFGYSQFRTVEGLALFEKVLTFNGFKNYDYDGEITVNDTVRYHITTKENAESWNIGKVIEVLENGTYKVLPIKSTYWYNNPELRAWDWESLSDNDRKYLTINNFSAETWTDIELESELIIEKTHIYHCKYTIWSGATPNEEKAEILKLYTDESNKYGKDCLILLTTQSGSEGISLKNVRQVHIFEPYWNEIRTKQVIGRARRLNSHILLPENERNVEVFNYQIKFNPSFTADTYDEILTKILKITFYDVHFKNLPIYKEVIIKDDFLTSDQTLNHISINKTKLLAGFLDLIKETSIDCKFNKQKNEYSDFSYKYNKCLNKITTSNQFTDHTYDLSIIYDDRTFIAEDKFIIMRAEINNLFVLIKYNDKYEDINQAIENETELDAYNFYKYYALGEFKDKVMYSEQVIGKLFLTPDGTFKMKFLEGENINQGKYKHLQQIIKKKHPSFPVTDTKQNMVMIFDINKEYNKYIESKIESESVDKPADESADEPAPEEPVEETKSKIVINKKARALELLKKKKQKKVISFEIIEKTINELHSELIIDVKNLLEVLVELLKINTEITNIKSVTAQESLTEKNITVDFITGFYDEIMIAYDKIIENKSNREILDKLIELIQGFFGHINHLLNMSNEINIKFKNINKENLDFNSKLEIVGILYTNIDTSIKRLKSQISK